MGYSSVGRVVEKGLRLAIPGSLLGGAVRGAYWGLEREEWRESTAEESDDDL
jgi:hypothetical protein